MIYIEYLLIIFQSLVNIVNGYCGASTRIYFHFQINKYGVIYIYIKEQSDNDSTCVSMYKYNRLLADGANGVKII